MLAPGLFSSWAIVVEKKREHRRKEWRRDIAALFVRSQERPIGRKVTECGRKLESREEIHGGQIPGDKLLLFKSTLRSDFQTLRSRIKDSSRKVVRKHIALDDADLQYHTSCVCGVNVGFLELTGKGRAILRGTREEDAWLRMTNFDLRVGYISGVK